MSLLPSHEFIYRIIIFPFSFFLFPFNNTLAQITGDATLGIQNSVVTPNVNVQGLPADLIEGGAVQGTNLFHSFAEFNVGEEQRVYFANPAGIENILTRVTGNEPSNIRGTLGVDGSANLFLLNPNGIIFGPKARLDVNNSFVASTANSLVFSNGFEFSTTNPQAPPLLTINLPLGLQYGTNAGSIQVQAANLQVPAGTTLALLGGNVNVDNGRLLAPGGRVELGGISATGTVEVSEHGNELRFSFPEDVTRADITLRDRAQVDVRAGGNGSIAINAFDLTIEGRSTVRAGIKPGQGFVGAQAGDIAIAATGATTLADESVISSTVLPGAIGNGGNLNITTNFLSVAGGAQLSTSTFGRGDAGNVTITATDTVSFNGVASSGNSSGARSVVEIGGIGKGGSINIITGSLSVTGGAQLITSTRAQGDAGNVTITASDQVWFDGAGSNGFPTTARSTVESQPGVGNGGNIAITAGSLTLTNGAALSASTSGRGNAGNVTITASNYVWLDGVGSNGRSSGAASGVDVGAVGNGGDVQITTNSLSLTNGALLTASTSGQGDAGSVTITASDRVFFDGVGSNGISSAASSQVLARGVGNGGNVTITTGFLAFTNGAIISASSRGQGDAGSVTITASDRVLFDGVGSNGIPSGAASKVSPRAIGNGGNAMITTDSLALTNGAQVSASSQGRGHGGSVIIKATDTVSFQEGAGVTVSSLSGQAGNLTISANSLLMNQGRLTAETGEGQGEGGANIALQVSDFVLMGNESLISAEAFGTANGGNINIDTGFLIALPPEGSNGSDIIANAVEGNGGQVSIAAQGVFSIEFRPNLTPLNDITASSEFGLEGTVEINVLAIDPSQGLVELPIELVDVSKLIDQNLCAAEAGSTFTSVGRGGLPTSPNETLSTEGTWEDWRITQDNKPNIGTREAAPVAMPEARNNPKDNQPRRIVEAQGWVIDANGNVVLTAEPVTVRPHGSWVNPVSCQQLTPSNKKPI